MCKHKWLFRSLSFAADGKHQDEGYVEAEFFCEKCTSNRVVKFNEWTVARMMLKYADKM